MNYFWDLDPYWGFYIAALLLSPVLAWAYVAITENFYWKGFRDGKRLGERSSTQRYSRHGS